MRLAYHRAVDHAPPPDPDHGDHGEPERPSAPSYSGVATTDRDTTTGRPPEPDEGAAPAPAHRRASRGRPVLRVVGHPVVVLMAVAIIAAVPRFYHLGQVHDRVFDEVYYTKDGCLYAGFPYKDCELTGDTEQSWVHPPLGKWMIAAGIRLYGNRPFGWRVSAAFFGTLTVVLIALMALVLWRRPLWAFGAGLLGATESLLVVQSRTTLLDIFEAFWVTAGFLFLVLDRRWIERRTPVAPLDAAAVEPPRPDLSVGPGAMASSEHPGHAPPGPPIEGDPAEPQHAGIGERPVHVEDRPDLAEPGSPTGEKPPPTVRVPSPLWRPWRIACGVSFGLAVAVKWSAVAALAGAMFLSWAWERTRRKRAGVARPLRRAIVRESFPIVAFLFLIPVLMYGLTYMGRIDPTPYPRYHPGLTYSWLAHPSRFGALTYEMQKFHRNLHAQVKDEKTGKFTPAHPYQSRPWSWLVMGRPVAYFYKADNAGKSNERRREIVGIGNPAIFWLWVPMMIWLPVMWRRRGDWVSGFILVAILSQYLFWYLPWPFNSLEKVQFFFYATPIAPFLVLGATSMARHLARMHLAGSRSRPFLPVSVAYVIVAIGLFVLFWPLLTGDPLSTSAWNDRVWFSGWI